MSDDLLNSEVKAGSGGSVAAAASTRFLNPLLAAMLLTLYGAIVWGAGEWWGRGLLLAHFGLFLIWQPVWRGESEVPAVRAILVLGIGLLFAVFGNWWLIATWIAVLFSLIGGGVPGSSARNGRIVSILAAVYLIAMLLMWVVPHVFADYVIEPGATVFVRYGLPLLPLVILAIPGDRGKQNDPVIVDLFYSVVLFLLVVALALGSFVIQQVSHGEYLLGLAQTLMVIALVLVGLSWLWNPREGVSGIRTLLSRYLLGLGLPFEQRMRRLARLAQNETHPERFLRIALSDLLDLPWVSGFAWATKISTGAVGNETANAESYSTGDLVVTMYSSTPCSPAILLHMNLLMQMIGHFYEAQRQEQRRQQSAYTQAIYQTGARLTHDIKNLLQSLRSLCVAAEMRAADDIAFRALVQRQLPQITQRLGATLEKLKSPETVTGNDVDATVWWQAVSARYAGRTVIFETEGDIAGMHLPAELFDSTVDTLIENALYKSVRGATVWVRVILGSGPLLRVCDDGEPVPADVAMQILHAPVASDSGLGVGLFQAATFARHSGYKLELVKNRHGNVCFELARAD